MSSTAELLFANDAFYLAFRHRDYARMEEIWAHNAPVSCTHPGWKTLLERSEVMASWAGIFQNTSSPEISARGAQARELGEIGLVTCYEILGNSVLAATNIFVREGNDWQLLHHHASQCHEVPPEILGDEDAVSLQ